MTEADRIIQLERELAEKQTIIEKMEDVNASTVKLRTATLHFIETVIHLEECYRLPLAKAEAQLIVELERANAVEQKFLDHTAAVGTFLSSLYAIMVDPLADGKISVTEACAILLTAAQQQRQNEEDLRAKLIVAEKEQYELRKQLDAANLGWA